MHFWLGIKTVCWLFSTIVAFFFTQTWAFEALFACRLQCSETSYSDSAHLGCVPVLNSLQCLVSLCPNGFSFWFRGSGDPWRFQTEETECLHYLLVISIISFGTKGTCSVPQGIQTLTSVALFPILKDFITLPTSESHCSHNSSLTLVCGSFFLSRNSWDCSLLEFSFKLKLFTYLHCIG